jgi:hypothetical protein
VQQTGFPPAAVGSRGTGEAAASPLLSGNRRIATIPPDGHLAAESPNQSAAMARLILRRVGIKPLLGAALLVGQVPAFDPVSAQAPSNVTALAQARAVIISDVARLQSGAVQFDQAKADTASNRHGYPDTGPSSLVTVAYSTHCRAGDVMDPAVPCRMWVVDMP